MEYGSAVLDVLCLNCLAGRKLSLSEQLTALVMFELPFYGLLPGAVPFIYFLGKVSTVNIVQ